MENIRDGLEFFLPIWDKMKAKETVLTSITFRYLLLTSRCKKLIWTFRDQQLFHDKDLRTSLTKWHLQSLMQQAKQKAKGIQILYASL